MAKLSEDYFAVPPGEVHPVQYRKGDEVFGELEDMARRDGKIAAIGKKRSPERKAHRKAPENKR